MLFAPSSFAQTGPIVTSSIGVDVCSQQVKQKAARPIARAKTVTTEFTKFVKVGTPCPRRFKKVATFATTQSVEQITQNYIDFLISSSGGLTGSRGETGATGARGPQGERGADGAVGPAGAVGPVGPVGPAGAVGAVGPAGPAGAVGPQGPRGADGANGRDGLPGPQGIQGPAGPQGQPGIVATVNCPTNEFVAQISSTGTPICRPITNISTPCTFPSGAVVSNGYRCRTACFNGLSCGGINLGLSNCGQLSHVSTNVTSCQSGSFVQLCSDETALRGLPNCP